MKGPNEAGMSMQADSMARAARMMRALTLLDRIGDKAADALIAGTAAVVLVQMTDDQWEDGRNHTRDAESVSDVWDAMLAAGRLDRGGA